MPIRLASVDHLDLDRVAVHLEDTRRRARYQGTPDPMTYLQQKHCLVAVGDQQYPTLAGLLCFGRDPQALFPNAVVDLGHYGGPQAASNDVIHLEKGIGGTLFDQIERTEAYLWRNTRHGMTVGGSSARRIELHEYPQAVIRELTVNMLAHRDYTMAGAASRVLLLSDRVEWSSPGRLPPGITETNLLSMRNARNAGLLTILYDAGFVEGYGMGLVTVVSVLNSEGLEPPQFRDLVGGAFMVTSWPSADPARARILYRAERCPTSHCARVEHPRRRQSDHDSRGAARPQQADVAR